MIDKEGIKVMEFKKIEQNNIKKVLLVLVVLIAIITTVVSLRSRAKYQVTSNAQIVNGVINYKPYDFKIVAIYKEKDTGGYEETTSVPTTGYEIDEKESKCMIDDNNKDTGAILKTIDGNHTFSNLKKRDKCTLYFNKEKTAVEQLLAEKIITPGEKNGFGTTDTAEHTNTLYTDSDDLGTTYYYRGKVNNNWVKFGKNKSNQDIYWRIIRINGDGTIRLIYAGEGSAATTDGGYTTSGTDALINKNTTLYNGSYNRAEHVGFQFKLGEKHAHGTGTDVTNSNVLAVLNTWFKENLAESSSNEWNNGNDKIDPDAGFCNDRRNSTTNTTAWGSENDMGGIGSAPTYYGTYLRLRPEGNNPSSTNKSKPTFKCKEINDDYFTYTGAAQKTTTDKKQTSGTKSLQYPVGLITADEVTFAGGLYHKDNTAYYLYNQSGFYWTMTPYYYLDGYAAVFNMSANGLLTDNDVNKMLGVRPVINLKANTMFKSGGTGTSNNPYEVS